MANATVRLGLRVGNLVLFTACCFLLADIVNEIGAALAEGPAVEPSGSPTSVPVEASPPSWSERERILDRNLFGTALVAAEAPEPEPEELEKTDLPLELAGTLASDLRDTRMAAIWNEKQREYQVLRPGDRLEHHPGVEVARVERGRVLLRNGNQLEELLLEDREERVNRSQQRRRAIREARRARVQEMRRARVRKR